MIKTPQPKQVITVILFTAILGLLQPAKAPGQNPVIQKITANGMYADLNTTKGRIILRLEYEKTPMTVANFVGLAEGTIKNAAFPEGKPFFDGTPFHRVVAGHVIQAGSAVGGSSGSPGYTFPNEIHPDLSHNKAGMLGMANSGPHTNASQFYITLGNRSYLDGDYTVFGRVIAGMDVVNSIVQGDTIRSISIIRVGKKAEQFIVTTESFTAMVEAAKERVKQQEEKKKRDEEALITKKWLKAAAGENGTKYIIRKEGIGKKPVQGTIITVQYTGSFLLKGTKFHSTADAGRPAAEGNPEPFEYEIGRSRINPGFDAAVKDMKEGEKRLVIVPGDRAYGSGGFYGKETPGKKRFVISPNTSLVYEIEVIKISKQ